MASSPSIAIGDLVYLYCDRNKSRGRDRYLVRSIDRAWCKVRKFVGSRLRSTTYRFKKAECYKVPMDAPPSLPHHTSSAHFGTDHEDDNSLPPSPLPQIPTAPPTPAHQLYSMLPSIRTVPVSGHLKQKQKRPFQFSVKEVFRMKAEHFSFKKKVLAS